MEGRESLKVDLVVGSEEGRKGMAKPSMSNVDDGNAMVADCGVGVVERRLDIRRCEEGRRGFGAETRLGNDEVARAFLAGAVLSSTIEKEVRFRFFFSGNTF